jgi:hypothetical protein
MLEGGLLFSEMTFRAPVMVASLAAILLLPWLARPLYGSRVALLFAWLLALSPVLEIYGGMVRPYAFVALLAPAVTLVALRWRGSGRPAWGLAWAVLSALCLWFHLATAPLLVAPFGLLLLEKARARMRRGAPRDTALPPLRDLAIAGAAAALLVAAFMVPLWESLRELYAAKGGITRFSFELLPPIARLQAGTAVGDGAIAATFLFWSLAVIGGAVLARRRPALVIYPVVVTLALWVGLAILQPIGMLHPIIFNRYLIGTLPLVLLLVAAGLDAAIERLEAGIRGSATDPTERSSFGTHAATVVVLVLLVASGPYGDAVFRRSSFQHNKDFIRFDQPRGKVSADAIPAFYREVRTNGAAGSIIEFPFRGGWAATRAHYVYQVAHRSPVIAAEPYEWPCDERLRLRNHVCSKPETMLLSPARYLVVHRDPLAEESAIVGGDDSGNRYRPEEWVEFARTAGRVTRGLRRRFGPPFYRDDNMTVWDLDEVRRRALDESGSAR